jgi:hypothetical protein
MSIMRAVHCLPSSTAGRVDEKAGRDGGWSRPCPGHPARTVSRRSRAQALEALGHEVIVADPNFAPMSATRSRRVKTDRRDARTLAAACRLGAYRATHRTSPAQRTVRAQLAVREALVRTRTRDISVIRAALRRDGVRTCVLVPSAHRKIDGVPLLPTPPLRRRPTGRHLFERG